MTFRTVVITKKSKLSYKNNSLIVRNDDLVKIYLGEIDTLIVDSLQVSITTFLLMELAKRNIKVIFCDHEHNPIGEVFPLYGSHHTSKKIRLQSQWDTSHKKKLWEKIIKNKICNQSFVLEYRDLKEASLLKKYVREVEIGDRTNREGHAAKVYFNALFGHEFNRNQKNDTNAALNYGYSLLISKFNKEIVRLGHVTQLGIHHRNEFNAFNLSYDLIEPFRPVVDKYIIDNNEPFNNRYKYSLVNLLNTRYTFNNKQYLLKDIIRMYTKLVLDSLNHSELNDKMEFLL